MWREAYPAVLGEGEVIPERRGWWGRLSLRGVDVSVLIFPFALFFSFSLFFPVSLFFSFSLFFPRISVSVIRASGLIPSPPPPPPPPFPLCEEFWRGREGRLGSRREGESVYVTSLLLFPMPVLFPVPFPFTIVQPLVFVGLPIEGAGLWVEMDADDLVREIGDLVAENGDLEVVEKDGFGVAGEEDLKVAGVHGLGEDGIVVREDLFILPLWGEIGCRVANMRVASLTARMRRASCLFGCG